LAVACAVVSCDQSSALGHDGAPTLVQDLFDDTRLSIDQVKETRCFLPPQNVFILLNLAVCQNDFHHVPAYSALRHPLLNVLGYVHGLDSLQTQDKKSSLIAQISI
jgi:hypothetical protein